MQIIKRLFLPARSPAASRAASAPKKRLLLCFLAAAALCPAAPPVVASVLNGASYSGALAPGTWAAIFGTSLTSSTATATSVPLATVLGGVTVTFGGVAAPLYYVSPGQINAVIPFEVVIPASGTVPVEVISPTGTGAAFTVQLSKNAPAIFTQNGSGSGAPLVFDASFKPVTVAANGTLIMYATGLGATNPAGSSNSGGATSLPLNKVLDALHVVIGDTPATIGFAGLAPGFPGIYQLNVTPNSPASDRIFLQSGGWQSNVTKLPATSGGNVAKVTGSIDGIYPATGDNIANLGGVGGGVAFSAMFTGANFTVDFDVVPNAKPFSVVATSEGGSAVINIDPARGTWQAALTSPTAAARSGDFSSLPFKLQDFATCQATGCSYFPANIIPASRTDPGLAKAFGTVPLPTTTTTQGLPVNGVATLSGTLTGNHFTWKDPTGFGGFLQISRYGAAQRSTTFSLYVDGVLVASKSATFQVFQPQS